MLRAMVQRARVLSWWALPLLAGCPEPAPDVAASTTGKTVVLVPGTSTSTSTNGTSEGEGSGDDETATASSSTAGESSGPHADASSGAPENPCEAPAPPCMPGEVESAVLACGHCGTQDASRTCTETCTWDHWIATSECVGQGCEPGRTMTMTLDCRCGDVMERVSTCSEACVFGEYVDANQCNFECCARVVYCNTAAASDPDVVAAHPGRGTWCEQTSSACSQAEVREGCLQRVERVCDALFEQFHIDYL